MRPIVQISLDLIDRAEALATAELALRAGVDWLEAGTPFILAEGLHGVRALRERFPGVPIVADLKTMDGGYLEAEMMAKAGATHVVVMARAHAESGPAQRLGGYGGTSGRLADSLADFASSYADQCERDFEAFMQAVRAGRLPAETEPVA